MPPAPTRLLPLQGASNFRDLGGYLGRDGRPLRWRRLFRSDHLGGLTPTDRQMLADLGLTRAIDFRGTAERAAAAYTLPGVTQYSLAIEPLVVQQMVALVHAGDGLDAARATGLMQDLYRSLVNDQAHHYAAVFAHLLEADAPLVFHCTAGKDRTGLAAAWILLALGVPRATVLQDYLLTNQCFRRPSGQEPRPAARRGECPLGGTGRQADGCTSERGLPEDVMAVLWQVQQGFLDAALDAAEQHHGGIERYLHKRLGLSPAALALLAKRYLAEA